MLFSDKKPVFNDIVTISLVNPLSNNKATTNTTKIHASPESTPISGLGSIDLEPHRRVGSKIEIGEARFPI
jgi:hypothetical protein